MHSEALQLAASDIQAIFQPYNRALSERNCIDFDDLLLLTYKIIATQPSEYQTAATLSIYYCRRISRYNRFKMTSQFSWQKNMKIFVLLATLTKPFIHGEEQNRKLIIVQSYFSNAVIQNLNITTVQQKKF